MAYPRVENQLWDDVGPVLGAAPPEVVATTEKFLARLLGGTYGRVVAAHVQAYIAEHPLVFTAEGKVCDAYRPPACDADKAHVVQDAHLAQFINDVRKSAGYQAAVDLPGGSLASVCTLANMVMTPGENFRSEHAKGYKERRNEVASIIMDMVHSMQMHQSEEEDMFFRSHLGAATGLIRDGQFFKVVRHFNMGFPDSEAGKEYAGLRSPEVPLRTAIRALFPHSQMAKDKVYRELDADGAAVTAVEHGVKIKKFARLGPYEEEMAWAYLLTTSFTPHLLALYARHEILDSLHRHFEGQALHAILTSYQRKDNTPTDVRDSVVGTCMMLIACTLQNTAAYIMPDVPEWGQHYQDDFLAVIKKYRGTHSGAILKAHDALRAYYGRNKAAEDVMPFLDMVRDAVVEEEEEPVLQPPAPAPPAARSVPSPEGEQEVPRLSLVEEKRPVKVQRVRKRRRAVRRKRNPFIDDEAEEDDGEESEEEEEEESDEDEDEEGSDEDEDEEGGSGGEEEEAEAEQAEGEQAEAEQAEAEEEARQPPKKKKSLQLMRRAVDTEEEDTDIEDNAHEKDEALLKSMQEAAQAAEEAQAASQKAEKEAAEKEQRDKARKAAKAARARARRAEKAAEAAKAKAAQASKDEAEEAMAKRAKHAAAPALPEVVVQQGMVAPTPGSKRPTPEEAAPAPALGSPPPVKRARAGQDAAPEGVPPPAPRKTLGAHGRQRVRLSRAKRPALPEDGPADAPGSGVRRARGARDVSRAEDVMVTSLRLLLGLAQRLPEDLEKSDYETDFYKHLPKTTHGEAMGAYVTRVLKSVKASRDLLAEVGVGFQFYTDAQDRLFREMGYVREEEHATAAAVRADATSPMLLPADWTEPPEMGAAERAGFAEEGAARPTGSIRQEVRQVLQFLCRVMDDV